MDWQIDALVELVRVAYPGWDGFSFEAFAKGERESLSKQQRRFTTRLSEAALRERLEEKAYAEIVSYVEQLGKAAAELHTTNASNGDLNILEPASDHPATFAHLLYGLLYGSSPLANRVNHFIREARQRNWPVKWTFLSYFLWFAEPDHNVLVKPRMTGWLLKFIGKSEIYSQQPTGESYVAICETMQQLQGGLSVYGASDRLDLQAFIATAYQMSRQQVGRLDARAQIDLDQPPTVYEPLDTSAELAAIREQPPVYQTTAPVHHLETISAETHLPLDQLIRWKQAIERKGQAILYGPPGTGKTFLAQHLARHFVGGGDGFWELVQFHPAYAYEDFIQGLRPVEQNGTLTYEIVAGRFLEFCQRANGRDRCVMIIDEINRADLARVFGELMYLLEYREESVALAAGGMLNIPRNVLLIGTMNTADRSVALIDTALRRRFAFLPLQPNYDVLRRFHAGLNVEPLVRILQQINAQLDPTQQLGVSFFLTDTLLQEIDIIWRTEIEPYLEEQFFDRPNALEPFRWHLLQARLKFLQS